MQRCKEEIFPTISKTSGLLCFLSFQATAITLGDQPLLLSRKTLNCRSGKHLSLGQPPKHWGPREKTGSPSLDTCQKSPVRLRSWGGEGEVAPGTGGRKTGMREPRRVRLTFYIHQKYQVGVGKTKLSGIFFCLWVYLLYQDRRRGQ